MDEAIHWDIFAVIEVWQQRLKHPKCEAANLWSSTSRALRKPFVMKYDGVVDEYCKSLAAQESVATDILLVHAVRLQRIAEHITLLFGYNSRTPPEHSPEEIELLVETFKCQLQDLRSYLHLHDSSLRTRDQVTHLFSLSFSNAIHCSSLVTTHT